MIEKKPSGDIRIHVNFEDFAKVFKVYEGFPFWESWTPDEVRSEYESYFIKSGTVFGYYIDGKCVSILSMHPIVLGEHPVTYDTKKKVMYLSDVATLPEYRNRGIATELFKKFLQYTIVHDYDYVYMRTNFHKEESMSAGIARKCGFHRVPDVKQWCEMKRVDGSTRKDLRCFYEKKIK